MILLPAALPPLPGARKSISLINQYCPGADLLFIILYLFSLKELSYWAISG